MLDVVQGAGLRNVLVVVTRYFGGTLLGTGGLVRAYSQAVQEGLANSVLIDEICGVRLLIETDYNGIGKIQYLLGQRGIPILESEYTDQVKIRVLVPKTEVDRLCAEITEGTNGKAKLEKEEELYFAQNCRKSYYNGQQTGGYVMVDFDASEAGLANNTKYDFTMTCSLDWEGEQHNDKDTFSFSFFMDDEAPVIREDLNTLRVKTDNAGNVTDYLLDMHIYDNQYVQGYFLYTYDYLDENGDPVNAEPVIKGMIPVDDFEGGKVNKITQDLTDLWYRLKDGEEEGSKNIGIQVYDYAKHSTSLYDTLKKTAA